MDGRLNIIVVEDHDALRDVTVEVLAVDGHSVRGVACAEAVDDDPALGPIDLIVVDLNLPGEDGLSLSRRFRAAHPRAGIIMVTARTMADDRVSGYASGADIFMSKPVDPAELRAAVRALGRRIQSTPVSERDDRPLLLDQNGLSLQGPLNSVRVSVPEALFLAAIARAPGRFLEHWQAESVMGIKDASNKSNLELRVSRVRRKLVQVGAGAQPIRAQRLRGYQLCVPLKVV